MSTHLLCGLALCLFAYLLGSINWAIIISKVYKLADPRTQGSGNPGATNVLRSGNKLLALLVLVGDVLKGVIPVYIGIYLNISGLLLATIGLCAILGHIFPIFFKFKGGKGVATAYGVFFSLSFILGSLTLLVFIIIVAIWRYVSLASVIAIGLSPLIALLSGHISYFLPLMLVAIMVVIRHKDNLQRLKQGTENKVKFGKRSS